jgi:hypothetical protein
MFRGDRIPVEALRSLYERLELRLWTHLPARMRRRLTTYGIADLMATPPLRRDAPPEPRDAPRERRRTLGVRR